MTGYKIISDHLGLIRAWATSECLWSNCNWFYFNLFAEMLHPHRQIISIKKEVKESCLMTWLCLSVSYWQVCSDARCIIWRIFLQPIWVIWPLINIYNAFSSWKAFACTPFEEGAQRRPCAGDVNNVSSNKFGMRGLFRYLITPDKLLKTCPRQFSLKTAAALFFCEAPEMFCRPWNFPSAWE